MKHVSVVTPCYNEEANIIEIYTRVRAVFARVKTCTYEHLFIDNASTDRTVELLKGLARKDRNLKIIVNTRNFGHITSPYHGLLQAKGDAVLYIASDLQEPPELLPEFLKKWEEGYKIVIGVKNKSRENFIMFLVRKLFYSLIRKYSEVEQIDNFMGFGLYDRKVIEILRSLNDPYPYFRGLISEIGFKRYEIRYVQEKRKKGKTKNDFYTLWDTAMLGFVSYSKVPLRMASFIGMALSVVSFLIAIVYFVIKLIYWKNFDLGLAPIAIGLFFFSSVQLFFIGIIGEYIGVIHTKVKNHPHVIELERVNFGKSGTGKRKGRV
jgi:polyisoprenyl-phosphate glycosyltransferase